MHYDYPVEVLTRSSRTRFQAGFARHTIRLMPVFKDIVLQPAPDGLLVLATDEQALSIPLEAIQQMHDGDVTVSAPRVRFFFDGVVQEPVMWLRVTVMRAFVEPVMQDLVQRGAEMHEVDGLPARTVVKARAPLRDLLGYPKVMGVLTGNTGEVLMWLSHYAPMPPPEPGNAA